MPDPVNTGITFSFGATFPQALTSRTTIADNGIVLTSNYLYNFNSINDFVPAGFQDLYYADLSYNEIATEQDEDINSGLITTATTDTSIRERVLYNTDLMSDINVTLTVGEETQISAMPASFFVLTPLEPVKDFQASYKRMFLTDNIAQIQEIQYDPNGDNYVSTHLIGITLKSLIKEVDDNGNSSDFRSSQCAQGSIEFNIKGYGCEVQRFTVTDAINTTTEFS